MKLKSINEMFYEFGLSTKEEYDESIDEALITFGGKAYPKFGQIVIISGGAGSGKGFIRSKLLGIEGIVLDVDRLKELVMASTKFASLIKDEFGTEVDKLNLRKKEDVSKLHDIVSKLNISDKRLHGIFTSIATADPARKPNLIFDVTLKDMTKFHNTIRQVQDMGYYKKNISLVWVLNTIDVAMSQNKSRSRVVADEILMATHDGASYTMSKLIKMGDDLSNYLDGDIYIAFNQTGVDSDVVSTEKGGVFTKDGKEIEIKGQGKSDEPGKIFPKQGNSGFVIKQANYVQLKKKEKPVTSFKDIQTSIIDKIKRYVPNSDIWN